MRSRPDVLRVGASTSGFRGVTTESNTLPLTPPSPVSGASRTRLQRLLERFVPHRAKRRVCRWAPGLLRPRTLCGFLSRNAAFFPETRDASPAAPRPGGRALEQRPWAELGADWVRAAPTTPRSAISTRAPFPAGVSALTGAPAAARSDQRGRRDGRCLGEGGGARAPLQLPGDEPRVQVHHPDVRKHHQ